MCYRERLDIKRSSGYPVGHPCTPPYYITNLLEALLGRLPVDDLPDSLEVLGLAVLVLEATVTVRAYTKYRTVEGTY